MNRAETPTELKALRESVKRGAPYGEATWRDRTAVKLNLESSLRAPWRPKRETENAARPSRPAKK